MDFNSFEKEFVQAYGKGNRERVETLCLEYMQGITDKISNALNPISETEAPFVIAALEICVEFIGQMFGREVVKLAQNIKKNAGYTGISFPAKDEQP